MKIQTINNLIQLEKYKIEQIDSLSKERPKELSKIINSVNNDRFLFLEESYNFI